MREKPDINASSGFTIIELLIAFTILALVAGTLFQVFAMARMNNSKAEEADLANIAMTAAIELFKADPENSESFVRYFDSNWNEMGTHSSDTRYVLEAIVTRETVSSPVEEDGREAAAEAVIDMRENYRVLISDVGGDFEIKFNGVPLNIDYNSIEAVLPINLVFYPVGTLPKKISIVNETETPVNLNVLNVPRSAVNDENVRAELIQVTPTMGSCGVVFYSDNRHFSERYMYYMTTVIKKAITADSGEDELIELANYSVGKYIVAS